MADSGRVSAKKRRLVAALASSRTVKDAADKAKIAERTAWRYLADPAVKAELAAGQDVLLTMATRGLVEDMQTARMVLKAVMLDRDSPPSARVSAARAILEASLRFAEMVALAERVAALEERMGNDGQS